MLLFSTYSLSSGIFINSLNNSKTYVGPPPKENTYANLINRTAWELGRHVEDLDDGIVLRMYKTNYVEFSLYYALGFGGRERLMLFTQNPPTIMTTSLVKDIRIGKGNMVLPCRQFTRSPSGTTRNDSWYFDKGFPRAGVADVTVKGAALTPGTGFEVFPPLHRNDRHVKLQVGSVFHSGCREQELFSGQMKFICDTQQRVPGFYIYFKLLFLLDFKSMEINLYIVKIAKSISRLRKVYTINKTQYLQTRRFIRSLVVSSEYCCYNSRILTAPYATLGGCDMWWQLCSSSIVALFTKIFIISLWGFMAQFCIFAMEPHIYRGGGVMLLSWD